MKAALLSCLFTPVFLSVGGKREQDAHQHKRSSAGHLTADLGNSLHLAFLSLNVVFLSMFKSLFVVTWKSVNYSAKVN